MNFFAGSRSGKTISGFNPNIIIAFAAFQTMNAKQKPFHRLSYWFSQNGVRTIQSVPNVYVFDSRIVPSKQNKKHVLFVRKNQQNMTICHVLSFF